MHSCISLLTKTNSLFIIQLSNFISEKCNAKRKRKHLKQKKLREKHEAKKSMPISEAKGSEKLLKIFFFSFAKRSEKEAKRFLFRFVSLRSEKK